jgi:hypothetical protein
MYLICWSSFSTKSKWFDENIKIMHNSFILDIILCFFILFFFAGGRGVVISFSISLILFYHWFSFIFFIALILIFFLVLFYFVFLNVFPIILFYFFSLELFDLLSFIHMYIYFVYSYYNAFPNSILQILGFNMSYVCFVVYKTHIAHVKA